MERLGFKSVNNNNYAVDSNAVLKYYCRND